MTSLGCSMTSRSWDLFGSSGLLSYWNKLEEKKLLVHFAAEFPNSGLPNHPCFPYIIILAFHVQPSLLLCMSLESLLQSLSSSSLFPLSHLASYSALKKDGQRLSTLMKRGQMVEAKPARPVTVYSLSLQNFQPPFFTLGKMEKCWSHTYLHVLSPCP